MYIYMHAWCVCVCVCVFVCVCVCVCVCIYPVRPWYCRLFFCLIFNFYQPIIIIIIINYYSPCQALVLPPILLPLLLLIEVIQQHGWPPALNQEAYSDELISAVSSLAGASY